jgi:hypothetical protein
MGFLDSFRKALGGSDPHASNSLASLESALRQLDDERAGATAQIARAAEHRHALLLQGSDAELAAHDVATDRLRLTIERLDAAEIVLLERLEAASSEERRARWASTKAHLDVLEANYVTALGAAVTVIDAVISARDHARAAGFEVEVVRSLVMLPRIVTREALENFMFQTERAADRTSTPVVKSPKIVPPVIASPASVKPSRTPRRDVAKEGHRLVEFLKGGFELPDSQQAYPGDIVALPDDFAFAAVKSATADYVDEKMRTKA